MSYYSGIDAFVFPMLPGRDYMIYRLDGPDLYKELAPAPELSIDMSSGKVKLTWPPVKAEGVTGYAIYRGDASRYPKDFKKIAEVKEAVTTFADETVAAGTKHAYRVYALKGKAEGRMSRLAYTQPLWVHGVVASVEDAKTVKVSWEKNPEPDIVGYNVYRAKGADAGDFGWGRQPPASKYAKVNAAPVKGEAFEDKVDLSDGIPSLPQTDQVADVPFAIPALPWMTAR
jgi:fibronectin type 3 domain-containing protein